MTDSADDLQLTESQEAFAVIYVQTGNKAEAYRRAYNKDENARDEWIYVSAVQMADHPRVKLRIKQLQEAARERNEYTIHAAMDELEEARSLAMQEAMPSAAVSAVNSKVKIAGLEPPSRHQVQPVGKDGKPVDPEMGNLELARNIAFILAKAKQEQEK